MIGTGILKGMAVTARNFVGSYFEKDRLITVQYPEERSPLPIRRIGVSRVCSLMSPQSPDHQPRQALTAGGVTHLQHELPQRRL